MEGSMRNQVLGSRYRIIDRIGEGGMAFVYVAMDEKLGRKVAIKVLHEHMEKNPDIRKRFQLEAQAVSSLEHPNIVKVYDFSGAQSERLWIVTEVIRGKNLAQYAQASGPGWVHPVLGACLVREICKALDKAHGEGIVHRDIKPENVMLTTEGRVKLMDFGIAKDLGKASMTVEGTFMGSPSYMSPEQIRGRDVDLRSDLYSLSVLFYEIITGRLPFTGQTTHDVVLRIIEGEFTHPRYIVPTIPAGVNDMIVKGMSRSPEARFQTAREMGRELDLFLGGLGFDESHIELERYFKDPQAYASRLQKAGIPTSMTRAASKPTRNPQLSVLRPTAANSRAAAQRSTLQLDPQRPSEPSIAQRRATPAPQPPTAPEPRRSLVQPRPPQPAPAARQTGYVPPPPLMTPRAPSPQPEVSNVAALREASAFAEVNSQGRAAPQPAPRRAPPRYVRRDAIGLGRRNARLTQLTNSWTHAMFGVLIVGIIGMVSIWGFWELQGRLSAAAQKNRELKESRLTTKPPRPSKARKTSKRRDGTPVVVKNLTKKPLAFLEAAQALGDTAPKAPKLATNGKKPKKPKGGKKPVVKDPPLIVETAEVTRPKKKKSDKPSSALAAASATPPAATPVQAAPLPEGDVEAAQPQAPQPSPPSEPAAEMSEGEASPKEEPAAKEEPKAEGKARVAISSQPAAELFIDGKRFGTTIDATANSGFHTLESGKHALELRRQGYRTYRTRFDLSAGDQKVLPQVVLEPDNGGVVSKASALTLRVSAQPASVVIRNIDNNSTQAFVMKAASRTVQLENGRYHIKIEHNGEVKERELSLTGNQGLTFSAEFKGSIEAKAPDKEGEAKSDE
jgi:serine/threonine protein kinase